MEEYIVKILKIEQVTHNVKRFQLEKPKGYTFQPGQATDVSINTNELKDEKRPFTFTSLNSADYLEFTIKIYTDHDGITKKLGNLKPGSGLIIRDVWGDIQYKGDGTFIAGGAGITPFISILRDLKQQNKIGKNFLIYANKTVKDIILENELKLMLGNSFVNILSGEKAKGYSYGFITEKFLKKYIPPHSPKYYLCGPPPMMEAVIKSLKAVGISEQSITMEKM
jgi:hypothetical protein